MRLMSLARASLIDGRSRVKRPSPSVKVEDDVDRAAAHGTKRNVVAREHDAIRLRPVRPARLVVGSLERPDAIRMGTVAKQPRVLLLLFAKQRVHLRFRPVRGTN